MQDFAKRIWIAVGIGAVFLFITALLAYLLVGALIIFAGIVLGVFLSQLTSLLSGWIRLSYRAAYAVVIVTLVTLSLATLVFMGARIAMEAGQFVAQFQEAGARLDQRFQQRPWWDEFKQWRESAREALTSRQVVTKATSAAYLTFSALLSAVFILFLGFYFAVQPERYRNGILSLVAPSKRERVAQVLNKTVKSLWYWTLGRLAGMLVVGAGTAIGLWLLGVPLPIPLGVLAGLLNFIPNFGPLIALIPAVLFGLQQGTDTAVYVVLFFLAIQAIESYLLTPLIDQHQVAFPPGLTLSVQLLFGLLAGLFGLLLAMPIAVVISVFVREFYVKDILHSQPVEGSAA